MILHQSTLPNEKEKKKKKRRKRRRRKIQTKK